MRKHYDFSKGRKNPYAKRLKKQITIRLDLPTIQYFKAAAESTGIPYQTLLDPPPADPRVAHPPREAALKPAHAVGD